MYSNMIFVIDNVLFQTHLSKAQRNDVQFTRYSRTSLVRKLHILDNRLGSSYTKEEQYHELIIRLSGLVLYRTI